MEVTRATIIRCQLPRPPGAPPPIVRHQRRPLPPMPPPPLARQQPAQAIEDQGDFINSDPTSSAQDFSKDTGQAEDLGGVEATHNSKATSTGVESLSPMKGMPRIWFLRRGGKDASIKDGAKDDLCRVTHEGCKSTIKAVTRAASLPRRLGESDGDSTKRARPTGLCGLVADVGFRISLMSPRLKIWNKARPTVE